MPVVSMELTGFSFKREHEDWIGPIEVSIYASDSCVVLTGINAGGKSLTLRALEKFTSLLTDPSRPNKEEFEALAELAGIDEISATYSFNFPEIENFYSLEIGNEERLLSALGAPPGAEFIDEELEWVIENRIETRFTKDGVFTRRFGVYLGAHVLVDEEFFTLTDPMFLKWHKVFDDPATLAKDKMFLYGPDGFERMIEERTGIAVDSNIYAFENHQYWAKKSAYQFVAKRVIMLQVDEAYRVSAKTIDGLRPFNKNANAKRKGKTWINKRLKTAFEECKKKYEEKWSEEFDNETKSIESQITKLEKMPSVAQSSKREEQLNERITRLKERNKEEYLQHNDRKLEFAKFLYPNRKTEYYVDAEGNHTRPPPELLLGHETAQFNWVSNPEIPIVERIISPVEMRVTTADFTDDMEGICARLMVYCPKLLLEYDRDMLFWIIVSSFIDFPDDQSPSYYSSGQRRMISMIEAMMNSEPGTVFLVDEPELSLHIDWQRRFIDQISVFGGRLVLATHSPDIIYNHTEKVVEVPPRSEV